MISTIYSSWVQIHFISHHFHPSLSPPPSIHPSIPLSLTPSILPSLPPSYCCTELSHTHTHTHTLYVDELKTNWIGFSLFNIQQDTMFNLGRVMLCHVMLCKYFLCMKTLLHVRQASRLWIEYYTHTHTHPSFLHTHTHTHTVVVVVVISWFVKTF